MKGEADDASVERIARVRLNRLSRVRVFGGFSFAFDFGDGVGPNKEFAFGFRHPEEISQEIEMRRNRHGFELGGHVGDIMRDVESLPRYHAARRIVGSLRRPRRSALSSSPMFAAFPSRETQFVGHRLKQSVRKGEEVTPRFPPRAKTTPLRRRHYRDSGLPLV